MSGSKEARSELMRAAQEGDAQAYRLLLKEAEGLVRAFLRKRLNNSEDIEDVVQQTLLRIHAYRHTFTNRSSFDSWMYAILRNCFVDELRAKKKSSFLDGGEAPEEGAPASQDEEIDLKRAFQSLPEESRRAISYVKDQGLSMKEAASREGISHSAFKVRAHRAYKSFLAKIKGEPPL